MRSAASIFRVLLSYSEDEGINFNRNFGTYLQNKTAVQPRRDKYSTVSSCSRFFLQSSYCYRFKPVPTALPPLCLERRVWWRCLSYFTVWVLIRSSFNEWMNEWMNKLWSSVSEQWSALQPLCCGKGWADILKPDVNDGQFQITYKALTSLGLSLQRIIMLRLVAEIKHKKKVSDFFFTMRSRRNVLISVKDFRIYLCTRKTDKLKRYKKYFTIRDWMLTDISP